MSTAKRFSRGFSVNSSYTFSLAQLRQRYGFARPQEWIDQAGQVGNVRHALKANWSLELPIGKERKYGASLPAVVDVLVGGWLMDGVARIQTGEVLDFGNVRLVGMTQDELQKEIKVQQGPGGQIFVLPADILDNTVKAFSVSATSADGYGSLGAPTGRYFAPANGPDCLDHLPGMATAARAASPSTDQVWCASTSACRKSSTSPADSCSSSVARC